MILPEHDCSECGYVFGEVPPERVRPELASTAAAFAALLAATSEDALRARPAVDVWSPLEYACHVRDVLWNLRDRILLALVEDRPVFAPLYREQRVQLGRYDAEPVEPVSDAIRLGADLLGWLIDGLDDEQLRRPCVYAGEDRDVLWIARQALHEARHHLGDASPA